MCTNRGSAVRIEVDETGSVVREGQQRRTDSATDAQDHTDSRGRRGSRITERGIPPSELTERALDDLGHCWWLTIGGSFKRVNEIGLASTSKYIKSTAGGSSKVTHSPSEYSLSFQIPFLSIHMDLYTATPTSTAKDEPYFALISEDNGSSNGTQCTII